MQPIADLVVEAGVLVGGDDVDVVAQAVEQLGAVRLRVDRLHLDPLEEVASLRALGLGVEVHAFTALPDAGQAGEGPEVGQGIGIDVLGLSEDVLGEIVHRGGSGQACEAWLDRSRAAVKRGVQTPLIRSR